MEKRWPILWISSAFLLLGFLLKNSEQFSFFFDGTFDEHKKWFPSFYVLSCCFFKLYIPFFVVITMFFVWERRVVGITFFTINIPIRAFFLFVIYTLLSLILPEYYPFSKYPMYSSWADEAYVFFLADSNNKMIPFNKVSFIDGAEMSHVYATLKNAGADDSVAGGKMMYDIKASRLNYSPIKGQINLKKTTLFIENNKIQTSEIRLYTDTLE